ncbi:MAG: recombination protein RecR [Candidatus Aminicenantes bacterium]|nr:recombination protein RecR [Candidatus Aminicenantes bacterium]
MHLFADSVEKLIEEFGKLPGVGPRTAERFAFYILKEEKKEAIKLAEAISEVKHKIKSCSICHNLTDIDPCRICKDPNRERSIICVVEEPSCVSAIEKTRRFKGLYHVLLGTLSPLKGIGPDELKISDLTSRIKKQKITEVIIATDSDTEGEATALYITRLLKPLRVKITRPARGIPVGGTLELAGQETIAKAFEARTEVK